MTIYRMATEADVDELAQMRWDFRLEEAPGATRHDQATLQSFVVSHISSVAPAHDFLASQRFFSSSLVCD